MEKIKCICMMRDLYKAVTEFEESLEELYGVSLNAAMVMCCISRDKLAAGEISLHTGLRASHLSKVLRTLEDKGFLTRYFGETDKRQIYFSLTDEALLCLDRLKSEGLPIPVFLDDFFKK